MPKPNKPVLVKARKPSAAERTADLFSHDATKPASAAGSSDGPGQQGSQGKPAHKVATLHVHPGQAGQDQFQADDRPPAKFPAGGLVEACYTDLFAVSGNWSPAFMQLCNGHVPERIQNIAIRKRAVFLNRKPTESEGRNTIEEAIEILRGLKNT